MTYESLKLEIKIGDFDSVISRKKNIWLGVSISMKDYDNVLAQEYLRFITQYSKDCGVVVVGDEISAINIQELEHKSSGKALRLARKRGDIWVSKYRENIEELELEDKVRILRWADIWGDIANKDYEYLRELYNRDDDFREKINLPLKIYLDSRGRNADNQRLKVLSEYILKELPFLLKGVHHNGIYSDCLLYPTYSLKTSLSWFVQDIYYLEKYGELRDMIDIYRNHYIIDSPIN
jgi:tRNA-dependent cyclodipeptide synthase